MTDDWGNTLFDELDKRKDQDKPCPADTVDLLAKAALPDPNDEREVPNAQLMLRAADLISMLQDRVAEVGQENRRLLDRLEPCLKLIEVSKCPNCDGSGGNAVQVAPDEWEQEQCQYCFEKWALLEGHTPIDEKRGPDDHPERWCSDCGRRNIVWFAPNKLWNQIMGSPEGIVCPACFAIRAECAGVLYGVWKLDLHDSLAVEEHAPDDEYAIAMHPDGSTTELCTKCGQWLPTQPHIAGEAQKPKCPHCDDFGYLGTMPGPTVTCRYCRPDQFAKDRAETKHVPWYCQLDDPSHCHHPDCQCKAPAAERYGPNDCPSCGMTHPAGRSCPDI